MVHARLDVLLVVAKDAVDLVLDAVDNVLDAVVDAVDAAEIAVVNAQEAALDHVQLYVFPHAEELVKPLQCRDLDATALVPQHALKTAQKVV